MSLRKGRALKKAQKHHNSTAYNPARYGQSRRVKQAAELTLGGLCARCKEKLEWKKKYDKYKPLTAPKKCIHCQCKQVKQAYYQICQTCAKERGVCAKCGQKNDIIQGFATDKSQMVKEEAEFRAGLKLMSERERRTLLREQSKGQMHLATAATVSSPEEPDPEPTEPLNEQLSTDELVSTLDCCDNA